MSELPYVTEGEHLRVRTERRSKRKSMRRWGVWVAAVGLWAVLIYGSFSLAQHYVATLEGQLLEIKSSAQQLGEVLTGIEQQMNQHEQQLTKLREQFAVVETELAAVKEEMAIAGDTIHDTGETRQALGQRITDLDKELANLQQSIAKLEEAARVY